MIANYLKTAWRNILKNKIFSAINVFGLAIGIGAFLLIVNYLRFEYSFDRYNTNADRIYRVPMTQTETGGREQTFAFTFPAVAPALKKDFPEIEQVVRFRKRWGVVSREDHKLIEDGNIYYVDPAVFSIFSFEFEKGTPTAAFRQLNDAVISKSTEKKYFGNENSIGKTFRYDNEDYVVTSVIKDVPANSHLRFNILLNYNKYIQITGGKANSSWGWSDFYTYVLIKQGTDIARLRGKMPDFAKRYLGDDMKKTGYTVAFQLEPLKDIHTKSTYDYEMAGSGNLYYLKYLGLAALFILLIALINYINLSTAHSLERSREVGVRKVIGATRYQLIRQFLAESVLLNIIGIGIGFALFKLLLPQFSLLIGRDVTDLQSSSWQFWLLLFFVFISSTLLAAFYPAFVLSSFQPVKTLKSEADFAGVARSRNVLRKGLVVLQFTAAIILIGGAIGFYRQLQFMSQRSLGIELKQTLVLQQTLGMDSSQKYTVEFLKNKLQHIPGVEKVTASGDVPGGEVGGSSSFRLLKSNDDKRCRVFAIDKHFIPNFGLSLAAGRNFDNDKVITNDTNQVYNIILNETAAKILGFAHPKDAIDQRVEGAGNHLKVIAVMHDYHQQSLQYDYDPIVFYPGNYDELSFFSVKIHSKEVTRVADEAKKAWTVAFPQSPMRFYFLDDHFNEQYKNDSLFATILWAFTILAIIVSSLGLLGLSLYTVAKRKKEISIRKILGASIIQITSLITKDYIKLILVAGIIALPLTWFLLQNWLNDYAFHISIGYWLFIFPIGLITLIALMTVLYQSVAAALANPAKNLRSE